MSINRTFGMELQLTADAHQAREQIESLQKSLQKLSTITDSKKSKENSWNISDDLMKGVNAANELSAILKNVKFSDGSLDLKSFSNALKQNGKTLGDYRVALSGLGSDGRNAFNNLADSILKANIPLREQNSLLKTWETNLKKAAAWQITNGIVREVTSSMSNAINYIRKLDESLTSIQIVTNKSSAEMAAFAESANKAAQALSTTTTSYTDAALIYFQQGLGEKEVAERTETTIKMAHVTGDGAKDVSSYMTAIWNNFKEGSESLEHYADVITALGATTASSSSEIADGLQKFASIGQTVGLSYDYATSALATVVAQTRQSADTVGTAFKTLFARIQDLELGDEGAVSLGKYAQALEKVGVNILDEKGNMKDMDAILDEMGAKWNTLSEKQQTALAQNVAGTRQYTQLVALMNNWDKFQANVDTARDSDGTLENQAEIYEKSWRAARERVKSSLENIYDNFIDEDIIVSWLDGLDKVLDTVAKITDSFGGMGGIIKMIAMLLTSQVVPALNTMGNKFADNVRIPTVLSRVPGLKDMAGSTLTEYRAFKQKEEAYREREANGVTEVANDATKTQHRAETAYQNALMGRKIEGTNQYYNSNAVRDPNFQDYAKNRLDTIKSMADTITTLESSNKTGEEIIQSTEKTLLGTLSKVENQQKQARTNELLGLQEKRTADLNNAKTDFDGKADHTTRMRIELDNAKRAGESEEIIAKKQEAYDAALAAQQEADKSITNIKTELSSISDQLKELNAEATGDIDPKVAQVEATKEEISQQLNNLKNHSSAVGAMTTAQNYAKPENAKNLADLKAMTENFHEDLGAGASPFVNGNLGSLSDDTKNKLKELLAASGSTITNESGEKQIATIDTLVQKYEELRKKILETDDPEEFENAKSDLAEIKRLVENATFAYQDLVETEKQALNNTAKNSGATEEVQKDIEKKAQTLASQSAEQSEKNIRSRRMSEALNKEESAFEETLRDPKSARAAANVQQVFGGIASGAMSAVMAFNQLNGLISIFNDQSMIASEKSTAIFSSALTMLPSVIMLGSSVNKILVGMGVNLSVVGAGLSVVMPFLPLIAGGIAAIFAIYKVTSAHANASLKEAEKKVSSLSNKVSAFKTEVEDAKSKVDSLVSAQTGYDEAIKRLNECKKGTQEWGEALQDAREKSRELAKNLNSELTEFDPTSGLYKIKEGKKSEVEDYLKELQSQQGISQAFMDKAENEKDYAQAEYDLQESYKKYLDPIDNGMADGIEKFKGSLKQLAQTADFEEFKKKLADLGFEVSELSDSNLQDLQTQVEELASKMVEASGKIETAAQHLINEILGEDANNYSAGEKEVLGQRVSEAESDFEKEYQNKLSGLSRISSKNDQVGGQLDEFGNRIGAQTVEEVWDELVKLAGKEDEFGRLANSFGDAKGGAVVSAKDADGNDTLAFQYFDKVTREFTTITQDEIIAMAAANSAVNEFRESLEQNKGVFQDWSAEGRKFIDDFYGKGIDEAVKGFSKDQLNTLSGLKLSEDGTFDENTWTDDVKEILGFTLEQFEATGLSVETLVEQINFAASDLNGFLDKNQNLIANSGLSDANTDRQVEYAEAVGNAQSILNELLGEHSVIGPERGDSEDTRSVNKAFEYIAQENEGKADAIQQFSDYISQLGTTGLAGLEPGKLLELAQSFGLSGDALELFCGEIDKLPKVFNTSVSGIEANQNTLNSVFANLKDNMKVSKGDMKEVSGILSEAGLNVSDYFNILNNGAGRLKVSAEEFQKVLDNYASSEYQRAMDESARARLHASENNNLMDAEGKNETFDYSAKTLATDKEADTDSSHRYEDELKATAEYLNSLSDKSFLESTGITDAANILQGIADGSKNVLDYETQIAQMLEAENQQRADMIPMLMESVATLSELESKTQEFNLLDGTTENFQYYSEGLIKLGEKYENCANEVENYQKALDRLSQVTTKTSQKDKEAAEKLAEQADTALKASIRVGELAKSSGIGADELENYAKQLKDTSEYLKEDGVALAEAAKDQARFDKAVISSQKNLKDWEKDIQLASESGTLLANDTLSELSDAYGNLLDIDGSNLSGGFLSSAENLKLFEEAANGSEEAYQKLLNLAQQDMNVTLGLDAVSLDDGTPFLDKVDAIENKIAGLPEGIDIAANLNDEGFLDELSNLVNAAGMTADQATDYLASMGIDAQVKETPVQGEEEVAGYSLTAKPGIAQGPEYELPAEDGKTMTKHTASFPTVEYTSEPVPTPGKKTSAIALEVTSAKKSSGGATKFMRSNAGNGGSSNGSRAPRGGGGSRGRSPRSGSGRTARNNRQESKKLKDEKERYHVINNQIEDLNDNLDVLSKAKDRAYGKSKIKLMDQEIAKQQQLIDMTKKYADEVKDYYEKDKKAIQDLGATFDKNGTITNYDSLIESWVNDYNAAVSAFNAATTDDEAAKDTFKAAEDLYKERTDLLKQYEETQDLWKDVQQQITDAENTYYDKLLEKTQYILELKIEIDDRDLELIEYLFDKIADRAFEAARKIDLLTAKTEDYVDKLNSYEATISTILSTHGYDGDEIVKNLLNGSMSADELIAKIGEDGTFTQAEVEQISSGLSDIISVLGDLKTAKDDFFDSLSTEFNDWIESMDSTIDKVNALQTTMEHYLTLVDLVGKHKLGVTTRDLINLNQKALDVSKTQVKNTREEFQAASEMLEKTKKERDAYIASQSETLWTEVLAGTLTQEAYDEAIAESQHYWKQLIDEQEEAVNDLQDTYLSTWEDTLEKARDIFDKTIEQIASDFSQAMAGTAHSLEALQNSYNQTQATHDTYVDDYEKIYRLSKLTRDIEKSIDETDNLKAKHELKDITEKIVQYQEKGVKISQYQIDYLQKEYELKMAQMALEEAQNSKSEVNLARDAEGNYGYVYTANQKDVADAEQNYADKLYEMEVLNAEYINTLQEQLIQLGLDSVSAIQDLKDIYGDNTEAFNEAVLKLQADYAAAYEATCAEMDLAISNNTETYEKHAVTYAELTGQKEFLDQEYLASFQETQFAIQTGYENTTEVFDAYVANSKELCDSAIEINADLERNIEETFEAAGQDIESFENTLEKTFDNITDDSTTLAENMQNDLMDSEEAWDSLMTKVDIFEENYGTVIDSILGKNEALVESFNKLLAKWAGVEAYEKNYNTINPDEAKDQIDEAKKNGGGAPGKGNPTNLSDGELAKRVAAAIWVWNGSGSGWGNDPERANKLTQKFGAAIAGQVKAILNSQADSLTYAYGWNDLKNYFYSRFDTGGYTGAWGNEGKFAMLDEKELVLNKDDTKNFLTTVGIVRKMSDAIDLNALSTAFDNFKAFGFTSIAGAQGAFQQEVNIHANFTDCDRNEILEAFSNMTNLAAQQANRKI